MKFIDTHCHLYDDKIPNEEVSHLINESADFKMAVLMGTNLDKCRENIAFANTHNKVVTCVGLHPEDITATWQYELTEIEKLVSCDKVVGIGEIGLDYHFKQDNKQLQKEVFILQLKLAKKHKLPVCIHTRDSVEDVYEILKNNLSLIQYGCVIHCFSETAEWAQRFIDLGCYISFCGNFTFKNYNQSVVRDIPLAKVMAETDSPYLSPVPFRGQVNNPTRVIYVVEKLAQEKNISLDKMAKVAYDNAVTFYGLDKL